MNMMICKSVLKIIQKSRKPDGDGLQDLSLHNFIVMRDKTADPKFLLQKKLKVSLLIYFQKNGYPYIQWLVLLQYHIQKPGR